MLHKAWRTGSIEVPYCFSRSFANFYPNWVFPDCNSSLNIPMVLKCCTKLNVVKRGALLFFKVIHQILRWHGLKNRRFESQFEITRPVAAIKSLRFALLESHSDLPGANELSNLECCPVCSETCTSGVRYQEAPDHVRRRGRQSGHWRPWRGYLCLRRLCKWCWSRYRD